jgi:hypothetical protein
MSQDTTILRHIFDYANRANPYPLWAKLRETPVSFQEDGPLRSSVSLWTDPT